VGFKIDETTLRGWADHSLRIREDSENLVQAEFDYIGSTCRDSSIQFKTVINIDLSRADGDWIVEDVRIELDAHDPGWLATCIHESSASPDPATLTLHAAPIGKRLREFLSRDWSINVAGCLCTSVHVTHKLILALSTVQYWLDHRRHA
jgi:hypothetical protein